MHKFFLLYIIMFLPFWLFFKEKEKEGTKVVGTLWFQLCSVLCEFVNAEKLYFTLTYIEKRVLRRDVSILILYKVLDIILPHTEDLCVWNSSEYETSNTERERLTVTQYFFFWWMLEEKILSVRKADFFLFLQCWNFVQQSIYLQLKKCFAEIQFTFIVISAINCWPLIYCLVVFL